MAWETSAGATVRTPLLPGGGRAERAELRDVCATVKSVFLAGAGLAADGYDLGVVNVGLAIFGHLYAGQWHPRDSGLVVSVTLIGMIIGQLSFGVLADVVGRKKSAITTSFLMIVGSAMSACARDSSPGVFVQELVFSRFILGLGIGGEFPLSAALAMETQSKSCLSQPQMLAMNALMMNLGVLLQYLAVLFLLSLPLPLEAVWRLAFAGGVVPGIVALTFRLQMEEPSTPQGTSASVFLSERTTNSSTIKLWHALLAVSACWFLFNFVAYSIGSFNSLIFDQALGKENDPPRTMIHKNVTFGMANTISAICGSCFIMLVEGTMSRCKLQAAAFGAMALLMMLCAEFCRLPSTRIFGVLTYALYCLVFFANASLGLVTYLIPGEIFPAKVRGTFVGMASASGKLGAAIGTSIFPSLEQAIGLKAVLQINSAVLLLGVFVAAKYTPERGEQSSVKGV